MIRVNHLSEQLSQASCRAGPPGTNPPAIERRRLKTGLDARCMDELPPEMICSPSSWGAAR